MTSISGQALDPVSRIPSPAWLVTTAIGGACCTWCVISSATGEIFEIGDEFTISLASGELVTGGADVAFGAEVGIIEVELEIEE